MMMIFIIPQSFMALKLPVLALVLLWILLELVRGHHVVRSGAFFPYYVIFSLLTIIWSLVGIANGNPGEAISDTFRVYVVYMWMYCALAIFVSNLSYESHVDWVVVTGALGIGLLALYTLLDPIFHLGLLPDSVKEDMFLQVGFHDGYTQMNNVNIGMLTFILPYLQSRLLLVERRDRRAYLFWGFIVAMASAVLASRRVVLTLAFITPMLVIVVSSVAGHVTRGVLWRSARFYFILFLGALVGGAAMLYGGAESMDGFVTRIVSAFDTDPDAPRPLQHAALMAGFLDSPMLGSGFGGITSVIRSDERPWTFELTYSRLLFNGGVLGTGLVLLFFSVYLFLALRKIRRSGHAPIQISLLTGFLAVAIASASNPYLSSFDFLFALSIIPLILNSRDRILNQSPALKEASL